MTELMRITIRINETEDLPDDENLEKFLAAVDTRVEDIVEVAIDSLAARYGFQKKIKIKVSID